MKLGRISTLLTDRATALYESLREDEQNAAQRIFLALCDVGEGRFDQCRQVHKCELINQRFSQQLIDRTLQKLVAAGLVVIDQPHLTPHVGERPMAGTVWETKSQTTTDIQHWVVAHNPTPTEKAEETITLAHKSLVSDWSLLRQWLEGSQTTLRQKRELEDRAWIWCQRGELKCPEYLLGQQYIKDIERFLQTHGEDLSTLAQRFIHVSQRTISYQRWQTRGIAVLLPLAMMAGMTVSLVRHQLAVSWRVSTEADTTNQLHPSQMNSTSGSAIRPVLPQKFGNQGIERLAITSQILDFNQNHPQSELSQISVTHLANLMTSGTIITQSPALTGQTP